MWKLFAALRFSPKERPLSASPTTVESGRNTLPTADASAVASPLATRTILSLHNSSTLSSLDPLRSPELNSERTIHTKIDHSSKEIPSRSARIMHASEKDMSTLTMSKSIIEAVNQFVHDERRRSFCFLAKHTHRYMDQQDLLVVYPANSEEISLIRSRDRNSHFAAYPEHAWFTFHESMGYGTLSHIVALTVPQGQDITIKNIIVAVLRSDGTVHNCPVTLWLRQTYDWDDEWVMKFIAAQYDEQQQWWDSTGKVFRLLDLPLELREAMYRQIIGPVILPDIHESRVVFGRGFSYGKRKRPNHSRDPEIPTPNMTIMRVCKQVNDEALLVGYRDTFKRLRMVNTAEYSDTIRGPRCPVSTIISAIGPQTPHPAFLRNVQLEMSAKCYFECIGIKPAAGNAFAFQPNQLNLRIFSNFPALQRMDFSFIGPKHPDALCPWAIVGTTSEAEHSCQKVWIDWFFTFAWDTLKAISTPGPVHLTLSGCVKTSSKAYWEHVLNDKRQDRTLAIKASEQHIRSQKTSLGCIPCLCSTPCSKANAEVLNSYTWDEMEIRRIEGLQEHIDDMYWSFDD